MARIKDFFSGVAREMRKTSWPKKKELTKSTITVVITVLIVMVYFIALDTGFTAAIREFL